MQLAISGIGVSRNRRAAQLLKIRGGESSNSGRVSGRYAETLQKSVITRANGWIPIMVKKKKQKKKMMMMMGS